MKIFIIVALVHVAVLFLSFSPRIKENTKTPLKIGLKRIVVEKPKGSVGKGGKETGGLSFSDLGIGGSLGDGKSNMGGGSEVCLDSLLQGIGEFPRSFFHKKMTGSAALNIELREKEAILKLSNKESWMIGGLLCRRLKERFEKLKGNSCLKKLAQKKYNFLFRLSLEIGTDEADQFSVLESGGYHRRITKMSKKSPVQALKVIANFPAIVELVETDSEKREWKSYHDSLSRFDCSLIRVKIF